MQCTGLKDKNGKLIYEGDILLDDLNEDGSKDYYAIVWDEEQGYWSTEGRVNGGNINRLNEEMKIVGNIHENPELMKEE